MQSLHEFHKEEGFSCEIKEMVPMEWEIFRENMTRVSDAEPEASLLSGSFLTTPGFVRFWVELVSRRNTSFHRWCT